MEYMYVYPIIRQNGLINLFVLILGDPFAYFTYGVAATVVEIDCLTGDHVVLKTDIVMDIGESINPAIDIGQIEGAFAQGYGLFMLEQMVHSPDGKLWTKGKLELMYLCRLPY